MNHSEPPDMLAAAARATINERCAASYLHEVRGSMQALFSAFELLSRAATSGPANPARAERACELGRRAIGHHERSTLEVLQILTLQHTEATELDVEPLLQEVVHFLRNEAASRSVTINMSSVAKPRIIAERSRLHTLLVGVILAAIDETPAGQTLTLNVDSEAREAIISVGCNAAYDRETRGGGTALLEVLVPRQVTLDSRELTISFAHSYLRANGGRLEVDSYAEPRGIMRLHYPCIVSVTA